MRCSYLKRYLKIFSSITLASLLTIGCSNDTEKNNQPLHDNEDQKTMIITIKTVMNYPMMSILNIKQI